MSERETRSQRVIPVPGLSTASQDTESSAKPSGGYVLAYDYWEQLTSATRNLWSLQCWAGQLNMSVVEPFVKTSYLVTEHRKPEAIKFSDVYNTSHWTSLSSGNALTPWDQFSRQAPRNLVRVRMIYGSQEREDKGKKLVRYLEQEQSFRTIRDVRIHITNNKWFHLEEFKKEVFGELEPNNCTILFSQWRGLMINRIQVRDSACERVTAHLKIEPSQRLIQEAENYTRKHLKTLDYLAIMVRMEKARNLNANVSECFQSALEQWERMVKDTGITTTFLSADVGPEYGSDSLTKTGALREEFLTFFSTIYSREEGGGGGVRKWESSFRDMGSGRLDGGYMAVLQRVLASRARCMLFVGGGSFQRNALQLYRKRHPPNRECIYTVESCTQESLLQPI